jgi:hypothetical protein
MCAWQLCCLQLRRRQQLSNDPTEGLYRHHEFLRLEGVFPCWRDSRHRLLIPSFNYDSFADQHSWPWLPKPYTNRYDH